MNEITLDKMRDELARLLGGRKFGRIFPLSRVALAIDFRLADGRFLFLSVEPAAPRVYLVERRLRDLEKQSVNLSPFLLFLRKRLSNAVVESVEKIANERVLVFEFSVITELGEAERYFLALQLTGRSANLLLLDRNRFILDKMRETFGPGQELGDSYSPPFREEEKRRRGEEEVFPKNGFDTFSEALDRFYLEKEAERNFQNLARNAVNKIKRELARREKLVLKLRADLVAHGDPEQWKRYGDLLLANLADAVRIDGKTLVVDYFDEGIPTVEIETDENDSLTAAAEKFFRRYTKARNAREEVARRIAELESQLADFRAQMTRVERAVAERDEGFLQDLLGPDSSAAAKKSKDRKPGEFNGARRFRSSDDFEILVGKASKDNDFLTFRVARAQDLWLHAADYPGSHVIVKNPNRREIPQKTLLEAAQLAAFYSDARRQPKVAVHYTPKKFVNKPKGAVPGLVSLSAFKTILVEPQVAVGE